jgi:hypothetical protein
MRQYLRSLILVAMLVALVAANIALFKALYFLSQCQGLM